MKASSLSFAFLTLLRRDLVLGLRHRSELVNPLLFFLIVVTMFPMALGPEPAELQKIAAGVIWVAAVLASSLSLDLMFRSDYEDGTLEQILLSPHSTTVLVMAKIIAHWLLSGAPLILSALILSLFLYMPSEAILPMLATLLLGTPVLSLVGSVAVALTVGLRGGGMLLALLILPLYMPLLIFAVAAVNNAVQGLSITGELYFLGALLILAMTLTPFATTASLRIRLS
ncbi:MAG: heme exporter protein B [Planctomycetota bacterium]|jgi:heme exporter protein B